MSKGPIVVALLGFITIVGFVAIFPDLAAQVPFGFFYLLIGVISLFAAVLRFRKDMLHVSMLLWGTGFLILAWSEFKAPLPASPIMFVGIGLLVLAGLIGIRSRPKTQGPN